MIRFNTDPSQSDHCWSMAEVCTPDATIHDVACGRGRHRWGKHRNRQIAWSCPPLCACARHRQATEEPTR